MRDVPYKSDPNKYGGERLLVRTEQTGAIVLHTQYCGTESFVSRAHSQVNDTTEPNHI